jgi:uncharacterized protein YjiS (DUF1127 family)
MARYDDCTVEQLFDELEAGARWTVSAKDGDRVTANLVVSGLGGRRNGWLANSLASLMSNTRWVATKLSSAPLGRAKRRVAAATAPPCNRSPDETIVTSREIATKHRAGIPRIPVVVLGRHHKRREQGRAKMNVVGSGKIASRALPPRTASIGNRFGAAWRRALTFFDVIAVWEERWRSRHLLQTLDDRMLGDVGFTRADAWREASKPFWER